MYASRECARLDGSSCDDCRDPDCECPHHEPCPAQLLGYRPEGRDLSCNLHLGHKGTHQLEVEWDDAGN